MKLPGTYILNGRKFSKKELLLYASEIIVSGNQAEWKLDIFKFIKDFLEENVEIIQETSGTTGEPKKIVLSRESMIRSAQMTIEHFGLHQDEKCLLCLPIRYIAGKMMVVRAMVGRMNLVTAEPSGTPLSEFEHKIDFAAMVPLQLFESMKTVEKLLQVKKLIIGGGEISNHLRESLKILEEIEVYETFAMTETYTHFATRKISGNSGKVPFSVLKGVTIGIDYRDCLEVFIPGVTERKITTNDLVEIEGNSHFRWLGRIDNLIKSGGIKIIPELLQQKIGSIINKEVAIIGVPDPKYGQKVVLFVEAEKVKTDVEELKKQLKSLLHKHEVPKKIILMPEFPRNQSMKLDRQKLKQNALTSTSFK